MRNISIVMPDLAGGNAQRAAAKLSCALSERNMVKMVLLKDQAIAYPYGGELLHLGYPAVRDSPSFPQLVRGVRRLRQFKRQHQIQATISFQADTSLINILSRGQGMVIVSVAPFPPGEKPRLQERLRLRMLYGLYNRADRIITASRFHEAQLVSTYGMSRDKIQVIHSHCDVEDIEEKSCAPIASELEPLFLGPVVITSGSAVFQKGYWYLIRAFAETLRKVPHARLVLLCEGEMEKDLAYLVRELDIEDRVHFLGHRENPYPYIRRSSVFVLPSLYEDYPHTLCEAMACGVPVISSDCRSGPREILSPLTDFSFVTDRVDYAPYGILVPPFDGEVYSGIEQVTPSESALAEAMVTVLTDKVLHSTYAMQAKSRMRDLSVCAVTELWEALLP